MRLLRNGEVDGMHQYATQRVKGTLSDNFWCSPDFCTRADAVLYVYKSVSDTVHHFGLLHHSYADDTQLCITIKKQDNYRALCVSEIQVWMNHNMLNKLTEFKQNVNTFAE